MDKSAIAAKPRRRFALRPPQYLTISFALMILVGALLLTLPIASQNGQSVGFLDALFTATSANCVTGLVVLNTAAHWSVFGKIVILVLIQLGGLGFITILTGFMMLARRRISLKGRQVIQAAFSQSSIGGMTRLVRKVVLITIISELGGALLLAVGFYAAGGMTVWECLYNGLFHAISAFCNAGFDILGSSSLIPYQGSPLIGFTVMALILSGGLGFTVLDEGVHFLRNRKRTGLRNRISHLSVHTKLVLVVTAVLLVGGAVLFCVLEWNSPNTLGPLSTPVKLMNALFQSVTLRTCGFDSLGQAGLNEASKFVSCLLMLVGGSPAGTAGGMKTITLAIVVIAMLNVMRGRDKLLAFERSLPLDLLQKALTVAAAILGVVFATTLVLWFSEQGSVFEHTLLDLFYETCSAAGTVGLSTGITPYLSPVGKVAILLCMFIGRLGPVTVVVALNTRLNQSQGGLDYPQERVIIG